MIRITANINKPISEIWDKWNNLDDIKEWCHASDDWHVPACTNDLRVGGELRTIMASKDGKYQFQLVGVYDDIKLNQLIKYHLADGRKVFVSFHQTSEGTEIVEQFDPEQENPPAMQRDGWQAILNNFKIHCEN